MGKTRDLLKNLEIPSKHFYKDGLNKGQTFHGPNRSRRYQKRQPKYTEELYIKDIHDPDNHDDVIIHLEPDILECKLKWVLGSITAKKASGGDRIPVELIQIPKDNAMKGLHSTWHQMWKISTGRRTGKGQFSLQSQRKAMPKNSPSTTQLHSSPMLLN